MRNRFIGLMLLLILMLAWNPDAKAIVVDTVGEPVVIQKPVLAGMQKAVVSYVIDGDTFIIESGEHVRLIGVDTPEKAGPYTAAEYFGEEATAYTRNALEGKTIYLAKDISEKDRYNRLLRYIYLEDGSFFNLKLVEEGIARAVVYPPDEKYSEQLREAEQTAQQAGIGLWFGGWQD